MKTEKRKTGKQCGSEKPEKKNCPTQWDGRLSGLLCWPHGRGRLSGFKTILPQRYSKMSILGVGVLGILRSLGILGEQPITKITPAQRDSGISILGIGRTGLTGRTNLTKLQPTPVEPYSRMSNLGVESKTTPAQPDSEISTLENSPYRPCSPLDFKTSPAQQDSGNSKLGVLGILGGKTKNKTTPVQRNSGIYKLKNRPYCSLAFKTTSAQRDYGEKKYK